MLDKGWLSFSFARCTLPRAPEGCWANMKIPFLLLLAALIFPGGCFYPSPEGKAAEGSGIKDRVEGIARDLLGVPYEEGPLGEGEGERIYREDAFDCTTFVLTVASRLHAENKPPREAMKKIHYYPPGEVSYENRLHFTSYRNRVSDYFRDITARVGGERTKSQEVLLNRDTPGRGRLLDMDWEQEITVEYVPARKVPLVVQNLPRVAGAGFIIREHFSRGLDIVHEGLVLDGERLVHASREKGKVAQEDFLAYLKRHAYCGVLFFGLNPPDEVGH